MADAGGGTEVYGVGECESRVQGEEEEKKHKKREPGKRMERMVPGFFLFLFLF